MKFTDHFLQQSDILFLTLAVPVVRISLQEMDFIFGSDNLEFTVDYESSKFKETLHSASVIDSLPVLDREKIDKILSPRNNNR